MHTKSCRRVGITGHRWNKISVERIHEVQTELTRCLAELDIESASITLVCGMAEGADLLAAGVCPKHWRLEPVLALDFDHWRDHLAAPPARVPADLQLFDEVMSNALTPIVAPPLNEPECYRWVGHHIATTCDHLVALWDGQPGKRGGTSEVVAIAGEFGVPLSILWASHWSATNQE